MPVRQIVNVRGCNAAGKTTLARLFLEHMTEQRDLCQYEKSTGKLGQIPITRCAIDGLLLPVYVVGPYSESRYSGCDGIKSMPAVSEAIKKAAIKLDRLKNTFERETT